MVHGKLKYTNELISKLEELKKQARYSELMRNLSSIRLAPTEQNAELGGILGAGLTGSPLGGAYVYEKTRQANAENQAEYQRSLQESANTQNYHLKNQVVANYEAQKIQSLLDSFQRKICDESEPEEKIKALSFDFPQMTLTKGGNIKLKTKAYLQKEFKVGASQMILDGSLKFFISDRNDKRIATGFFTPDFSGLNSSRLLQNTGFGCKMGDSTYIETICKTYNKIDSVDNVTCQIYPMFMWTNEKD